MSNASGVSSETCPRCGKRLLRSDVPNMRRDGKGGYFCSKECKEGVDRPSLGGVVFRSPTGTLMRIVGPFTLYARLVDGDWLILLLSGGSPEVIGAFATQQEAEAYVMQTRQEPQG